MTDQTGRISALNDQLRRTGTGGRVVLTAGIAALPPEAMAAVVLAVQVFEGFTPDNDPHGEHDFGLLDAAGERVMFKIDYYDLALAMHSPDAANPEVTIRVLTIMLASDEKADGWWEAVVVRVEQNGATLRLKWRDFTDLGEFSKPLTRVAIPPANGAR